MSDTPETDVLAGRLVREAKERRESDLPLPFDATGASLGTELRWESLRKFAREATAGMECAKPPAIPWGLPAAT
ncbi:hypothetical protein ACUN3E_30470 [Streptomyces sp. Ju416(a)]|uniref:hypothetical protein n=1 Tax=unclassified Streptomyces TaxID=2593676 RepID=UPI000D50CDC1|nr:hypothetical protein [Streptomyces sp. CS014]PVC92718.1 hypothetical protein DBP12_22145 [Streptomyces sp. CS014]